MQEKVDNGNTAPTYRWVHDPFDFRSPGTVYHTAEIASDGCILVDVADDGSIIGVENYGGPITVDHLFAILADPRIRFDRDKGKESVNG